MLKKKIFFPWQQEQKDTWIQRNKDKIKIIKAINKDFYSKKEKATIGKLTTIFYKDI